MFQNWKMQIPDPTLQPWNQDLWGIVVKFAFLKNIPQLILIINRKWLLWIRSVFKIEEKQQVCGFKNFLAAVLEMD